MPFELQPVLRGELIELRPLQPEDWDALFAVASDPLIWEQHPEWQRYQEPIFRKFFREALECGGALIALDASTGAVIGSSRYFGYDAGHSVVEVGWSFLARSHWGGRYNGEMKRLMLEHAFRFVDRVILIIGVDNIRSQRAAEKIGAVRVGLADDPERPDRFVYEITRAGYGKGVAG
jgi:N-acetyltransferase